MTPPLRVGPIISDAERQAWDDLASKSPVGHRHQCLWWMEPLARYGIRSVALGCWKGDSLVGGALFRSYSLPLVRRTVTECLDGPIFIEWDGGWADAFVTGVEQLAKESGCIAVVFRDCPEVAVYRDVSAAFRSRGHRTGTIPGASDAVLPLAGRTLDQIKKGFNHGTRARIRKALAGQLNHRELRTAEELEGAYRAWIATATRKSFTDIRPWLGIEPVLRHVLAHGLGSVHGAFLGDELLAAAFVVRIGKSAAYVYGGYMDGAEKHSPTHVLQFEAIRESLERGMSQYNFGMLIAERQAAGRGVDEFKLGFGAVPEPHLETLVWMRRPLLYRAVEHLRQSRMGGRLAELFKSVLIRRGNQD